MTLTPEPITTRPPRGGVLIPRQRRGALGVATPAPGLVVRRRLVDRLRRGVQGPLTVVSAPAGYGKTQLVAAWAAGSDLPRTTGFTRMVAEDQAPGVFWASVLASLRRGGLDVPERPAAPTAGGRAAGVSTPVAALARSIAHHDEPVCWVLDCGEFTLSPGLGEGIERLLADSAENLHLVVLTRADPPLPLHRFRLQGELAEIRAADLVLDASEAAEVFGRAGLQLTTADVALLRARTGGWPAGLRFAALALAGPVDTAQAIEEFRGDTGNMAQYLMSEVFTQQTPAMREFLLRTCVADELEPGIVAALTGEYCDAQVLAFLASGHTFLEPVHGRPGRYRFQPLLGEFLRSRLSYERPELVPELHHAAAVWLAAHREPYGALQHAVLATDWVMVAELVVHRLGVSAVAVGDRSGPLQVLLADLPDGAPGRDPALVRAALALVGHDRERMNTELDRARGATAERPEPGNAASLAQIVLEAVGASRAPDLDEALCLVLATESAAVEAAASEVTVTAGLLALLCAARARVLLRQGEPYAALEALSEARKLAAEPSVSAFRTELEGISALIHAMVGQQRRATQLASRVLDAAASGGPVDGAGRHAATLTLAWVRIEECEVLEAQQLLRQVGLPGPTEDVTTLRAVLALLKARVGLARGNVDLARAGLRAAAAHLGVTGDDWWGRQLRAELVESFVREGRPAEALTVLGPADGEEPPAEMILRHRCRVEGDGTTVVLPPARAVECQPLGTQVQWWLERAEDAFEGGERDRARRHLESALRTGSTERLRRPFLEATPTIRALLGGTGATMTRWLEVPGAASSGPVDAHARDGEGEALQDPERSEPADRTDTIVVECLTRKEHEVLVHLAELLTTEEIAEVMFVSVNTVRSHVRSILRKLGVTRRNAAVRRAWDLGLLPRPRAT